MKRLCLLILFIPFFASAQTDTTSFGYANSLYEKGQYEKAIPVYENLLRANGAAATIYYDLGNAYYKTNQLAKSILNYERCLRIKPDAEDARYNLSIADLRIKDQMQPVQELFLARWWRNFILLFSSAQWPLLTIAIIWLAFASFLLYRFSKSLSLRKTGFYLMLLSLVLFAVVLCASFSRKSYDAHYHFAIVMDPSVIVKNEPNESSSNLTLLHEGFKLRILDKQEEWMKVKLPDGNVGWLLTTAVQEI